MSKKYEREKSEINEKKRRTKGDKRAETTMIFSQNNPKRDQFTKTNNVNNANGEQTRVKKEKKQRQ